MVGGAGLSRGPLAACLKSVAAVIRFRSGDQRLIARDAAERNASRPTADRGQLLRCCSNGHRRCPVQPSGPLDQWAPDGLRRSFYPVGRLPDASEWGPERFTQAER
jgi:hypothetical protein